MFTRSLLFTRWTCSTLLFMRPSNLLCSLRRLGSPRLGPALDFPLPIALVENSGRCKTNEHGEKILPDGTLWVPNLMKEITVVISNGSKPIHVDQKLIDGPNPNNCWKIFIPLILAGEYFLVVKGIRRAIHADIANGKVDDWEQHYRDLIGSRDPVEQKGSAPRNRMA